MDKTLRPQQETEDKTLRPQQGTEDKTLRPSASPDKTMRPQTSADKTLRPQSSADKTLRPQGAPEKTLRPDGRKIEQQQTIAARQEYELNGKKYEFVKVISDSTGEAEILLVKHKNNELVLKLYFAHVKANHDILEKVKKARGSVFLVDIIEHGKWTNPDNPSEVRDFELMTYCKGGSLEDYWKTVGKNPEILEKIILKAACSIDFFHKQNLIHRDVKPANFLFLNEKPDWQSMVLSDFGISIESDSEHKAEPKEQLRTKVYAAPESYALVTDEKGVATAQISDKSDFYSLGMMMLELWKGKEEFGNIKEHELVKMKNYDNLPYPEDMPPRLLDLLRALTVFKETKRAGFAEIEKWKEGKKIFIGEADDNVGEIKIIYNAEKKQIARSKPELVTLMLGDKENAKQYLYREIVRKWFEELKFNEAANELHHIVETKYPKDRDAGLMAACYYLDDELLYTDITAKELTSVEDIAASLIKNKTKYADALANHNNLLWIYFHYRGGDDIVANFQKLFTNDKSKNADAVLALAYGINPELPFKITNEDGKVFECQKVEDVIEVAYNETLSDESWEALRNESFRTWLRHKDPAIAGKLLSTPGHDYNTWCVLYNLSPKVSFNLQMDEKAGDYHFDLKALCAYLDDRMISYIMSGMDDESYDSRILDQVCNIENTRLYFYMKSKGWDKQTNWIKGTMNIESKENKNKYAPNTWRVCFYKTLKGLNYDPAYYFSKSKKYITSLEELKDVPKKEILHALENEYLSDYLTIFFHENPSLNLKTKFTFEKETVKYLEKLEELNPNEPWVYNFRIGTSEVEGKMKKNKRLKSTHLWSKLILGVLTFALTAFTIYEAIKFVVPQFDAGAWANIPAIVIAVLVGLILWLVRDWELIWAGVIAVVCYFIMRVLLAFAIVYLNYVVAGILFLWLVMAIIKGIAINNPFKYISSTIKGLNFEGQYVEPLHFAFKANEGDYFKSSISDDYNNSIYYIKEALKKFFKNFIPLFLVSALLLGTNIYFLQKFNLSGVTIVQKTNRYEQFIGKYEGKFDNREATLEITNLTENEANATITVKYNNTVRESLKGKIDLENNTFHFDKVPNKSGNLAGAFDGTINQEAKTLTGQYQNYKTKKKISFTFSKIK